MSQPDSARNVQNTLYDPTPKAPSSELRTGLYQPVTPGKSGVDLSEFLSPPQAIGELGRLGHYRVLEVIGRGGMGIVLLAEDTKLQRRTALKLLLPQFSRDRQAHERFLREARSAAKIKHDNVVTIYQVDEERGVPYLAMELLKGTSLEGYLEKKGEPTIGQVLRIGRDIAEGLRAAHEKTLIHRDIKPANIWLEAPKGRAKILDFGFARDERVDVKVSQSGAVIGTPAYMSPEQAKGDTLDARSDIFSFGVVLYRLSTGKEPFTGANVLAVLTAVVNQKPMPPRQMNSAVPVELEFLIGRMLEKDPDWRPRTAKEIAESLTAIMKTRANAPTETPSTMRLAASPLVEEGVLELPADTPNENRTASFTQVVERLGSTKSGEPPVGSKRRSEASDPTEPMRPVRPKKKSLGPWIGVVAAIMAIAVGAFFLSRGPKDKDATMTEEVDNKKNEIKPPSVAKGKNYEPVRKNGVDPVEPKPGEERVFDVGNNVKMTFCWIPGSNGKFMIGSPKAEQEYLTKRFYSDKRPIWMDGENEYEVAGVDGFWMAKYEMTQRQYMNITGKKNPSHFCADKVQGKNTDDFPVEQVSWFDAQECIKEMKRPPGMKRIGLPSEVQWEWACRGGRGNGQAFYFGDDFNGEKANRIGEVPYGKKTAGRSLKGTEKVGSYEAKAPHPWGLCDMHGNVLEWCEDYYGEYSKLPGGKNPVQTVKQSDEIRVLRSGSWINPSSLCRSANRGSYSPVIRYSDFGFRVVLSPQDESANSGVKTPNLPPIIPKAAPKPGEEGAFDVGNNVKMTFCWIPGSNGKFMVGSPKAEQEYVTNTFHDGKRPIWMDLENEYEVAGVDGFWMAKYEMTQRQYMNITGKKNPSYYCADGKGAYDVWGKNTDDFPVEQVPWNEAQECIKKMKLPPGMKRIGLPSEVQWEWACRGGRGNGQAFYFGDILNGDKANCNGEKPYGTKTEGRYLKRTEKVGSYEAKAPHPWGLCDMHGNVMEWCEDYSGEYSKLPGGKNPVQTIRQSGEYCRVRGGSLGYYSDTCRSASRFNGLPSERYDSIGFRVVLSPQD